MAALPDGSGGGGGDALCCTLCLLVCSCVPYVHASSHFLLLFGRLACLRSRVCMVCESGGAVVRRQVDGIS